MNIFRRLRWKLTLSYTVVTVCALLTVTLILGGILLSRIFLPNNYFTTESLVEVILNNTSPILSSVLSESPVNTEFLNQLLINSNMSLTDREFLRIGDMRFSVRTVMTTRMLIIGADRTLLAKFDNFFSLPGAKIGQPFDVDKIIGLSEPFNAAIAGVKDPKRLFTEFEPENRLVMTIPVNSNIIGATDQIVGVAVIFIDTLPTQRDIPRNVLIIAGRFLLIFLFGAAIMGAIFGAITANGLSKRFNQLSTTTDRWSDGDFSNFIEDSTGDQISQFAQRLNNMAKQMQNLMRRRQEMAVSEERNRLARDLHDSAKQQALAASFELGTTLTLFDTDPQGAKKHLEEADHLVDSVRKELTNLVHELRPQPMEGQEFSEILKDYLLDWSQRSEPELDSQINIDEEESLSLEIRETLFRIIQEALANIARHSGAKQAVLILESDIGGIRLTIQDNGRGFDPSVHHSGVGLRSMHERAEGIGGRFSLESSPGQGVKIDVTLPYENSMRRDDV